MSDPLDRTEMLALLEWLQAMGATAAVDDVAHDWLARGPVAPGQGFSWPDRSVPAAPAAPVSPQPPVPPTLRPVVEPQRAPPRTPLGLSDAESGARKAASQAQTLDDLRRILEGFDGCGLKATATKLCFYRGIQQSKLMLIGEAPGRDEDLEGRPFVGRAGKLLDKMLAAIGLSENDVHIANVVYWRPPGNRTPTPQEALACRPFLERQVELVAPDIVLALGGAAAKEVLGTAEGIMRLRGKWREVSIGGRKVSAMATLHPAYLLRTPAAKAMAWLDLLQVRSRL